MTRVRLRVIGLALLASVSLPIIVPAGAGEANQASKCTLETLKGQYLVSATGTLFPPGFGRHNAVGFSGRRIFSLLW
jgi:hypothetical protein